MRLPKLLLSFLAPALAFALAAVPAQADKGQFSVTVAGFGAGTIAYRGNETGGSYKASGQVASTGLARGLYPANISVGVNGRVDGNRYSPSAYTEKAVKKGKTKTAKFRYSGGVPRVTKNPPDTRRKSYHAEPGGQKGTVDPMTAAYAILRDRPAELACKLDISPYDGRERTRIRFNGGTRKGDIFTCNGTYTRVAGFSPKEMAEKANWPFSVIYRVLEDDTYRVQEVIVPTTLGKVRMRRK